jgi:cyclopropane-fatty-acyl-phospholipid synthase
MLKSKRIKVALDPEALAESKGDAEFVIAAPRLLPALKILIAPNLWLGETYVAGSWYLQKGALAEFLRAGRSDATALFKSYYEFLSAIKGIRYYLAQYAFNRHYTRQVKRHYDVDAAIYGMILDEEMVYTCGFFPTGDETLVRAQQEKLSTIIARLALPRQQCKVLDMGCGWGALTRALVKHRRDIHVCGLSISPRQIEWAKTKAAHWLSPDECSRIEYRAEDYVAHSRIGYYDAVAVVGMIEHVGLGGYSECLARIYAFLRPGGTAVIHTIISPTPGDPTNRWIDRHIFKGGYIPASSELLKALEKHPFQVSAIYLHSPRHYRRTIELWLENFLRNSERMQTYLKTCGLSESEAEKLMRTWAFYLSAVRNMFADDEPRSHQVVHLCIRKV